MTSEDHLGPAPAHRWSVASPTVRVMSDQDENGLVVEMSRENLARCARSMASSLESFADRIEHPRMLAWHEVLSQAASVFNDVMVITDLNGPEIIRAWLCEQQRMADIAAQN